VSGRATGRREEERRPTSYTFFLPMNCLVGVVTVAEAMQLLYTPCTVDFAPPKYTSLLKLV
jgi:hypothetical protein